MLFYFFNVDLYMFDKINLLTLLTRSEHVESKIGEWRRAMEERVLNISRKKTE